MLRPPLPARRDTAPVGALSPKSMPPNQQPQKPAPPLILIPRDTAPVGAKHLGDYLLISTNILLPNASPSLARQT